MTMLVSIQSPSGKSPSNLRIFRRAMAIRDGPACEKNRADMSVRPTQAFYKERRKFSKSCCCEGDKPLKLVMTPLASELQ
jgi:hypothetical protein